MIGKFLIEDAALSLADGFHLRSLPPLLVPYHCGTTHIVSFVVHNNIPTNSSMLSTSNKNVSIRNDLPLKMGPMRSDAGSRHEGMSPSDY
jgi:hypothetical protein